LESIYRTKFNEVYGESRTIIDNDFILDTKSVKVVFAPPVMREEVAGRIMIHLYKVENGVKIPDNFKPRIAYFLHRCDYYFMEYSICSREYSIYVTLMQVT
jgi:hypothetical protein